MLPPHVAAGRSVSLAELTDPGVTSAFWVAASIEKRSSPRASSRYCEMLMHGKSPPLSAPHTHEELCWITVSATSVGCAVTVFGQAHACMSPHMKGAAQSPQFFSLQPSNRVPHSNPRSWHDVVGSHG